MHYFSIRCYIRIEAEAAATTTTMATVAAAAAAATTAIKLMYMNKNVFFLQFCPSSHLFQTEQIKFISINDDTLR